MADKKKEETARPSLDGEKAPDNKAYCNLDEDMLKRYKATKATAEQRGGFDLLSSQWTKFIMKKGLEAVEAQQKANK